jgi:hypothetical protein
VGGIHEAQVFSFKSLFKYSAMDEIKADAESVPKLVAIFLIPTRMDGLSSGWKCHAPTTVATIDRRIFSKRQSVQRYDKLM